MIRLDNDQDLIVNVKTGDTDGVVTFYSLNSETYQSHHLKMYLVLFHIYVFDICGSYQCKTVLLLWPHDVTSQTSLVKLVERSYALMAARCSLIFYTVSHFFGRRTVHSFIIQSLLLKERVYMLPSLVYMTSFMSS